MTIPISHLTTPLLQLNFHGQAVIALMGFHCTLSLNLILHWLYVFFLFFVGYQMEVKVHFCSCEPDFLRLLRFNLWGATPTKPELAFTLDLMKLLHTLNLECQVAVKDFCAALQTLTDDVLIFSVRTILYLLFISYEFLYIHVTSAF